MIIHSQIVLFFFLLNVEFYRVKRSARKIAERGKTLLFVIYAIHLLSRESSSIKNADGY